LDLTSTFKFVILAEPNTPEYQRADYTFNTVLRLNDQREYLRQARKKAFGMYRARLYQYDSRKNQGAPAQELAKMIEEIQTEAHPTVWKEMKRQYKMGLLSKFDPALSALFDTSPEALTW